jgi:hypothetical protein
MDSKIYNMVHKVLPLKNISILVCQYESKVVKLFKSIKTRSKITALLCTDFGIVIFNKLMIKKLLADFNSSQTCLLINLHFTWDVIRAFKVSIINKKLFIPYLNKNEVIGFNKNYDKVIKFKKYKPSNVCTYDNLLFITNYNKDEVSIFNEYGTHLKTIYSYNFNINNIAIAKDRIFVGDSLNNFIKLLDFNGNKIANFGIAGPELMQIVNDKIFVKKSKFLLIYDRYTCNFLYKIFLGNKNDYLNEFYEFPETDESAESEEFSEFHIVGNVIFCIYKNIINMYADIYTENFKWYNFWDGTYNDKQVYW